MRCKILLAYTYKYIYNYICICQAIYRQMDIHGKRKQSSEGPENRIIDKVRQNEEYQKAKEEETKAYDLLMSDLTEEQKQRLDNFINSATWNTAIWERMAYQQGMKDFLSLLVSLLQQLQRELQRIIKDFSARLTVMIEHAMINSPTVSPMLVPLSR